MAEPAKRTTRKAAPAAKAKRSPARKATAAKTPTSTAGRGVARTSLEETTVVPDEILPAAAPPRKRASSARPAARAAAALRGEAEEPDAPPAQPVSGETLDVGETTLIPFRGRNILVRTPTGEQLVIYRRISLQFQALEAQHKTGGVSGEDALKHMDRATRLIQSVMVNEYDRDWLEDEMLMGRLKLDDAADILTQAFAALKKSEAQQGNRQQRRSRAALED